ncbi:MAG: hypothetical protein KF709_06435 [Gemmatimonadaceae bacterium]|nr:hypothetical protein [Gemmatimonadaceae bacterium]
MLKKLLVPVVATTLMLGACTETPLTPAAAAIQNDYALQMFGESGMALEGTMGPQTGDRPFDGRTGRPPLPDSLKLTDEQKAEIEALRLTFRTEWQEELDALKAIFEEARAARADGATREEVHAILVTGRPIAETLRPAVLELHYQILGVLTEAQRAWLFAHRHRRMPRPMFPG